MARIIVYTNPFELFDDVSLSSEIRNADDNPVEESAMLRSDASLQEVKDTFANDRFATDACGCNVVECSYGHSVCEFEISDIHLNAQGNVMGGAIFTLADFALAIACNLGENPTVSVHNDIEFIAGAKGTKLIATCDTDKSGRNLGFYRIEVRDDLNTLVAVMTATCFRRA